MIMRAKNVNRFITIIVAVSIGAIAAIMLFALIKNGSFEDTRETRQYGNLTCVYNVTQDKIEDCSGG